MSAVKDAKELQELKEVEDHKVVDVNIEEQSTTEENSINKEFDDYSIPFKKRWELFWSFKNPRSSKEKRKPFFWNPPGRSKYEKRLVFKLDCIILTYVCLSFFIRYLDQSNVSNAYVSGMKEDLNLHGNMYNWLNSSFYIVYSVCGLPLTVLITRVKPHILLPAIEILWGLMCLLVITCKNYKTLMVVRTIQGGLEGGCFPILHYILGTWFTKDELSARTALFIASGALGEMFGGYIQSGVYRTLNGKAGLPGWRWIFVIDFIITVPVAILGYFVIPDSPTQAKPNRFLSQKDLDFCAERVRVIKKVEIGNKFNLKVLKKLLTSWQFYVFTFYYCVGHLPTTATSYWAIVLKAQGYDVYQRNNIPTTKSAFNVVACIVGGLLVDVIGRYWEVMTAAHSIWIIALSILVKWKVPRGAQFYAYITSGISGLVSTLCCSWTNETTREDNQLRAAVLGSLNLINIGPSTAFSTTVFNTDYAPEYEKGTRIALGICITSFLTGFVVLWFDRYQRRKRDFVEDQAAAGKITAHEEIESVN